MKVIQLTKCCVISRSELSRRTEQVTSSAGFFLVLSQKYGLKLHLNSGLILKPTYIVISEESCLPQNVWPWTKHPGPCSTLADSFQSVLSFHHKQKCLEVFYASHCENDAEQKFLA